MSLVLVLVLIIALLGTDVVQAKQKLTPEENDMIAEYMAGLLLKYDLRYDEKLLYDINEEDNVEGTIIEESLSSS